MSLYIPPRGTPLSKFCPACGGTSPAGCAHCDLDGLLVAPCADCAIRDATIEELTGELVELRLRLRLALAGDVAPAARNHERMGEV